MVLTHTEKNVRRALHWCTAHLGSLPNNIVISGGVGRNEALRGCLQNIAQDLGIKAVYPPARLCTDNGVMIAWAGVERLNKGFIDSPDSVIARPEWPLDKSGISHFPSTTGMIHKHKSKYVVSPKPS